MTSLRIFGALVLSFCGLLAAAACSNSDDATTALVAEPPVLPLWTDIDVPSTELTPQELSSALNASPILAKLTAAKLVLPTPLSSSLSRADGGIAACIAAALKNLKISVTTDSLRLEYALDLTKLCDEAPKSLNENVTEISNTARGLLVVSCPGADFQHFAGKTLADVQASGNSLCAGDLTFYAMDMQYAARKVTKIVDNGAETFKVEVDEGHQMWSKPDGKACQVRNHPDKHNIVDAGNCRYSSIEKSFSGLPADESKAVGALDAPTIFLFQADFSALQADPDAPFYANGTTNFKMNGWSGTLTYTNGWAAPRWTAKRDNTTEETNGTLSPGAGMVANTSQTLRPSVFGTPSF